MNKVLVCAILTSLAWASEPLSARPADCGPPHRHYAQKFFYLADFCFLPATGCSAKLDASWIASDTRALRPISRIPLARRKVYEPE
jgi:hypothetical protein